MTLKRLLVSVETPSLSEVNVNECERVTQNLKINLYQTLFTEEINFYHSTSLRHGKIVPNPPLNWEVYSHTISRRSCVSER